jgi:uncharacterized protein YcaQ
VKKSTARKLLVTHLGLARSLGKGARGTRAVLERLRCIQLDPLDVLGTNADLVVMARVDDVKRGDVWRHLFPKHAFEHFAKERCILPADAFPYYQKHGHEAQTHWWKHGERERRLPPKLVQAVLDEIRERGPLTARDLTDHGKVEPLDWAGWMGTSKATTMALEMLWTTCDIVVSGRTESREKIYDIPERTFGDVGEPREEFARWALRERVNAAGLLTRAGGAMWSMLDSVRTTPLVDAMIEEGAIVEVELEDSPRRYLALPEFLATKPARYDDRVRILGPLDPLLWDRNLVRHVFHFEYVWEVYKPAHQRKWGWYVCPLLYRDTFIGRIDARVEGKTLIVKKLWLEGDGEHDDQRDAIVAALERHAQRCGANKVRMPRRW